MESYKQEFIDFMVESHVLKFGEFTLKSGKKIPVHHECRCLCDRITAQKDSVNITQKQSMTNTGMILMYYSDLLTKESRLEL